MFSGASNVASLLLLASILLSACVPSSPTLAPSPEPTPPATIGGYCGDGVCTGPENGERCPEDCVTETPASEERSPVTSTALPVEDETVLYLGIMVHLEHWDDARDEAAFRQHAQLVREYADLFEAYGARLTWESKELTDGIERWGDNVLREMEQRGHGIGVHADIGGYPRYDCDRFADELRAEREQLESLGVTVRHVSGIPSHCDWVTAAAEAGYLFTTGQVAYSVMSMPEEERPVAYRHCANPLTCHDVFPPRLADRIHPWRMNSGADWLTHDPNGKLVMLAASQGLACMEEELSNTTGHGCTFAATDIDEFTEQLEEAIALSEPGEINVYYIWWSLGEQFLDKELLEQWLGRIQPYVQAGQVEWRTLPEMYEAYVQWEQRHH